jgi:hypothetical protein
MADEILPVVPPDADEGDDLAQEIADTAAINQIMDTYIEQQHLAIQEVIEISEKGNPVATHMALLSLYDEILNMSYDLQHQFVRNAERGESFSEKGGELRTQVLDDEETEESEGVTL